MKRAFLTLFFYLSFLSFGFSSEILIEGFEYANHDMTAPTGWRCDDHSWLCGYQEKDHNRVAHSGNWYAFTNNDDSWMFMDLYMSNELKYRYSCWAISDGSFQLEFWGGDNPTPSAMSQLFISTTINSGEYEKVEEYIESISSNYQYLGIHAIAAEGAHHLTIDDIVVYMVDRYDMVVTPYEIDTVLYPGNTIVFNYTVHNTGYESMHVYMNANSDYFTDFQFTNDGYSYSSFPTEPNQVVQCTCTATLSPTVQPGTRCWFDIMFTVSCDCITRLSTIWVNVLDEVADFPLEAHFDNPQFMKDGWIVMNNRPSQWEWTTEGDNGCLPVDESAGMLCFNAAQTTGTSLLVSPKMVLNNTGNQVRLYLYRTNDKANKEDRLNVYINTEMSLHNATLLETIHRSTALSPATDASGWYQCDIDFDSPTEPVFLIFEAVGDQGDNLYLDEIAISNTTLPTPTVEVSDLNTNASISIFPNPAKDHVQINAIGLSQVQVIDLTGRLLLSVSSEGNTLQLTTEGMKPGIYFINVTTTEGVFTHKLLKL